MTLLLIPVNRYLAVRIQSASGHMMIHKDRRVAAVAEALAGGWRKQNDSGIGRKSIMMSVALGDCHGGV